MEPPPLLVPPLLKDGGVNEPNVHEATVTTAEVGNSNGIVPSAPAAAPAKPKAGSAMWIAVGVTGLLAFCVFFTLTARGADSPSLSYRFGSALGWMTIWPSLITLPFLILRWFRSGRAVSIIFIATWGVLLVGQTDNLLRIHRNKLASARSAGARQSTGGRTSSPGTAKTGDNPAGGGDLTVEVIDPKTAREFDFSPGSDQRLIKEIDRAQADRYGRVVAAYRAAMAAHPNDAQLALEWVRFVQHFANAEDSTIERAEADYARAKSHLEQHFPTAPGTVLFQLEELFGEDFDAKVREATPRLFRWSEHDAAKFYLIQAQRARDGEKPALLETLARRSFELESTPDAAVLLAQTLVARQQMAEAAKVLDGADFASATTWLKTQRMQLLFDVGRVEQGRRMLAELKRDAPGFVRTQETAQRLGRAGLVREGREIVAELGGGWNAVWAARKRFEFELEFGDAGQAAAAYEAWQRSGSPPDPLAREWARVLRRHPSAPWGSRAILSTSALAVAVLLAAAAPLLVLVPVHHWSLWRRQRGKTAAWPIAPWGLRATWWLLGITCAGELLVLWYFFPTLFTGKNAQDAATDAASKIVPAMTCRWVIMTIVLVAMFWRAKAWRLVGPGKWSTWKAIGVGVGFAFALRAAVFFYIMVAPTQEPVVLQIAPGITQLLTQQRDAFGPLGMLAVLALFVPLLEEVTLRGVMLGALAKHIPFAAANIIQAVGFAALHDSWVLAPFYFGFALIAGELVRRSGGLLPALVMHGVNNAVAGLAFLTVRTRLGL